MSKFSERLPMISIISVGIANEEQYYYSFVCQTTITIVRHIWVIKHSFHVNSKLHKKYVVVSSDFLRSLKGPVGI